MFDPATFMLPEGEEFFGCGDAEFIGGKGDESDESNEHTEYNAPRQ